MSAFIPHNPVGVLAVGIDSVTLIKNVGVVGTLAVVFAESGLLVGFFLPGDSLLFALGLLRATKPDLVAWPIGVLCVALFLAAAVGDQTGYLIGKRLGPKLFEREDSRLFKRQHLHAAEGYFDRHGARTIVIARFVPIVRTFAPVVAGASAMNRLVFTKFNLLGAALWTVGITLTGYMLGKRFPWIGDKIEILSLVIIAVSVLPMLGELLRHRRPAAM
jgi:membrane-associated protein